MEANAYTVVYGSENLKTAAEKLAGYLKNVTGTECPVTDALPQGKYILLNTAPLNTGDGYKITGEGENVLITGSSLSWTVRGAFAFLEKYCGVKCLAPDIIRYTQKDVTVPDGKGLTYKPFFEFTDTDWKNARDTDYCLFNGINSGGWRSSFCESTRLRVTDPTATRTASKQASGSILVPYCSGNTSTFPDSSL